MVLMSTPARSKCVAVVCRMTCGLIAFLASDGHAIAASVTYRATVAWTTNRVIGARCRLRNTGSSDDRPGVSARTDLIVTGQRRQSPVLLPFPRTPTQTVLR